jgi:hypothetical protein
VSVCAPLLLPFVIPFFLSFLSHIAQFTVTVGAYVFLFFFLIWKLFNSACKVVGGVALSTAELLNIDLFLSFVYVCTTLVLFLVRFSLLIAS